MSQPLSQPEPSLYRVTVVVGLEQPAREGFADAVLDALPLDVVPAMADRLARDGAVTASRDGHALDVVLLVEAATMAAAERTGVRAALAAVRGAGLGPDDARLGQVRVEDAYDPGAPAAG